MNLEGSDSHNGHNPKKLLKVHTIPTETPDEKSQDKRPRSFETDEDFEFRRHSGRSNFGDRLQEFQNVRDARRFEDFNSSFQGPMQGASQGQSQILQQQPTQQTQGTQSPQRLIPMPMMYYYQAGQNNGQPYAFSPQNMGVNFQAMNQFLDAQYHDQQPQHFYPSLMPAPSFYPPSSQPNIAMNKPDLGPSDSRSRRQSFMVRRGRRLSLLNRENEIQGIVSPHKDVPESEFYRYMDTSFAQDLKMKQLFSWCLIRCLRKWEADNSAENSDSRKISLTILKAFVHDIRKGTHDIDWDSQGPEEEVTVGDETEISNLFNEDDKVDGTVEEMPTKNEERTSKKLSKIPNEKNIQNEENIKVLNEKISKIREEIAHWSQNLSEVKIPAYKLKKEVTGVKLPDGLEFTATTEESLKQDLRERMDSLRESTRLLKSTSELLDITSAFKLKTLNNCMVMKKPSEKLSTKKLLRGLTRSLLQ